MVDRHFRSHGRRRSKRYLSPGSEVVFAGAKSLATINAVGYKLVLSVQDNKIEVSVTMRAAKHDHGHQAVPSDLTLRVKALESLLVEKGLVDPAALDALIDTYEYRSAQRRAGGGAVDVGKIAKDVDVNLLLGLFLFESHPDRAAHLRYKQCEGFCLWQ